MCTSQEPPPSAHVCISSPGSSCGFLALNVAASLSLIFQVLISPLPSSIHSKTMHKPVHPAPLQTSSLPHSPIPELALFLTSWLSPPFSSLAQAPSLPCPLSAHRWQQPWPGRCCTSCTPGAARWRWGRCSAALPATAAASIVPQRRPAAGPPPASAARSGPRAPALPAGKQSQRVGMGSWNAGRYCKESRGPWYLHSLL